MSTERLVKWSKEAQEFFEKAEDNSVVLDLAISFGCASQTGEGFEELVNSINSPDTKRKIKNVVITDTCYLYRHDILEFTKYFDITFPTEWYKKNEEAIKKLTVPTELRSWASGVKTNEFKKWYRKIMVDFAGDENGNNSVLDFRNQVLEEARSYITKKGGLFKQNIDFILEECAYACAFFRDIYLVYPGKPTISMEKSMGINNIKFSLLDYKISKSSSKINKLLNKYDTDITDQEKSKLYVNKILQYIPGCIYWKDINGTYLGCNQMEAEILGLKSSDEIVGKTVYDLANQQTAALLEETDKRIMSKGITEELVETVKLSSGEKLTMLTKKSPFYDDEGNITGIIGVSLDITDRKKAEEFEKQKELYDIAKGVAHDICSPISALEIVKYVCKDKLPEEERKMFELSITSIKNITNTLLRKYTSMQKGESDSKNRQEEKIKEQYIMPYSMKEIIEVKRYQYRDKKDISINFYPDNNNKFVFIKGNMTSFQRLISNLLNNEVEAIEGKEGEIEVWYEVKGEEVEVRIKDNGEGMPCDMVEKINRGMAVGTTKENGHGIGMEQIIKFVGELKGKMEVKSKEGEGTEFVLRFARSEKPKWFADKIEIKKGSVIVALDDDIVVHEIWNKRFKEYEGDIEVKYFRNGLEVMNYLNSMSMEEKEKALLFTDYKFKGQDINGINVIEKTNMKAKHILVTNKYLSEIKEFEEKSDFLKICLKMYLNEIPLSIS